jgi:hypothetical protein
MPDYDGHGGRAGLELEVDIHQSYVSGEPILYYHRYCRSLFS